MKIRSALVGGGEGAVLADEHASVVRLWTLARPFRDGRVARALRRFFPAMEIRGEILRLGGFRSLAEAQHFVAEAKMNSRSVAVQGLVRYDVLESLETIKHYA